MQNIVNWANVFLDKYHAEWYYYNMKSKHIFILFIFAVLCVIGYQFINIYYFYNYQIVERVDCDSSYENCFNYIDDEDNQISYKYISKSAKVIKACMMTENKVDCNPMLSCLEGEEGCTYEYCSVSQLDAETWCSKE